MSSNRLESPQDAPVFMIGQSRQWFGLKKRPVQWDLAQHKSLVIYQPYYRGSFPIVSQADEQQMGIWHFNTDSSQALKDLQHNRKNNVVELNLGHHRSHSFNPLYDLTEEELISWCQSVMTPSLQKINPEWSSQKLHLFWTHFCNAILDWSRQNQEELNLHQFRHWLHGPHLEDMVKSSKTHSFLRQWLNEELDAKDILKSAEESLFISQFHLFTSEWGDFDVFDSCDKKQHVNVSVPDGLGANEINIRFVTCVLGSMLRAFKRQPQQSRRHMVVIENVECLIEFGSILTEILDIPGISLLIITPSPEIFEYLHLNPSLFDREIKILNQKNGAGKDVRTKNKLTLFKKMETAHFSIAPLADLSAYPVRKTAEKTAQILQQETLSAQHAYQVQRL